MGQRLKGFFFEKAIDRFGQLDFKGIREIYFFWKGFGRFILFWKGLGKIFDKRGRIIDFGRRRRGAFLWEE